MLCVDVLLHARLVADIEQTHPHASMMSDARLAFLLLVAPACAQFGNLAVSWDAPTTVGAGAQPRLSTEAVLRDYKPLTDVRREALPSLSGEALTSIAAGIGATCPSCQTQGHWVSAVRGKVLELPPKALRVALQQRGVRCDACTREMLTDKLLDSVHLPPAK